MFNYSCRVDVAALQASLPNVDLSAIDTDFVDFGNSEQVDQLANALDGVDFEGLITQLARLYHVCDYFHKLKPFLVTNSKTWTLTPYFPTPTYRNISILFLVLAWQYQQLYSC